MRLEHRTVTRPLRGAGHVAAHGTVRERTLVHVVLRAEDGCSGHGEAAPLPGYDPETLSDVRDALEQCREVVEQYPGHAPVADVLARCGERTTLAPALAALDLALWDLAGRRVGEPVWRLLGAADPFPVEVNATIAATDRGGAAHEAAQARAAGFRTIKAKVALGDDAGRLAAIRAFAGPGMAIRIDANGGWSKDEAAANLRALAATDIELCEEPVHGLDEIRALHGTAGIPLCLDESAADPEALTGAPSAELICLKIVRCGGITGLLRDAARARSAGYEVLLASTLDGPLGIAAALHAAAVLRPSRASGLATLERFTDPPGTLTVRVGTIPVPTAPGLGPDALRDWY